MREKEIPQESDSKRCRGHTRNTSKVCSCVSTNSPAVVGDDLDVIVLSGSLDEPDAGLGMEVVYSLKDDVPLTAGCGERRQY